MTREEAEKIAEKIIDDCIIPSIGGSEEGFATYDAIPLITDALLEASKLGHVGWSKEKTDNEFEAFIRGCRKATYDESDLKWTWDVAVDFAQSKITEDK